jgi:hypothetical protein
VEGNITVQEDEALVVWLSLKRLHMRNNTAMQIPSTLPTDDESDIMVACANRENEIPGLSVITSLVLGQDDIC